MNKRRILSNLQRDGMSWALIVFCLLLLAWAAVYLVVPYMKPQTTLRLGDGVFTADVITKPDGHVLRAAESPPLDTADARLFVYSHDGKWPVTIQRQSGEMDIVWLGKNKKVVYIVKNVKADDASDVVYTPRQAARYVLELPVRTVESRVISNGSLAAFDEHKLQESDK